MTLVGMLIKIKTQGVRVPPPVVDRQQIMMGLPVVSDNEDSDEDNDTVSVVTIDSYLKTCGDDPIDSSTDNGRGDGSTASSSSSSDNHNNNNNNNGNRLLVAAALARPGCDCPACTKTRRNKIVLLDPYHNYDRNKNENNNEEDSSNSSCSVYSATSPAYGSSMHSKHLSPQSYCSLCQREVEARKRKYSSLSHKQQQAQNEEPAQKKQAPVGSFTLLHRALKKAEHENAQQEPKQAQNQEPGQEQAPVGGFTLLYRAIKKAEHEKAQQEQDD